MILTTVWVLGLCVYRATSPFSSPSGDVVYLVQIFALQDNAILFGLAWGFCFPVGLMLIFDRASKDKVYPPCQSHLIPYMCVLGLAPAGTCISGFSARQQRTNEVSTPLFCGKAMALFQLDTKNQL